LVFIISNQPGLPDTNENINRKLNQTGEYSGVYSQQFIQQPNSEIMLSSKLYRTTHSNKQLISYKVKQALY